MAGSLVDRATSDLLIGPDWAMNLEICDILNHDPGQAKDAVRGLRKRLGSRNPKVQLLALTLLETVVKNCSDIVHMHVAEKDIPHKMVKMVKKKHPDVHVKEKILVLIDTWQEAFGGPQARYPQYYAAYQELLGTGAVFPQRPGRSSVPVLTPPQIRPLASYPQTLHNTETQQKEPESSNGSGLPPMSLTDIQNARGIMDVLAEMLNALDLENKEGIKQEVIVDLVEQCRSYKKKVLELVSNTFMNEELLSQGLALNDDLEHVLAKHDSIAAGNTNRVDKPKSLQALVDIDDSTDTYQDNSTQADGKSTSNTNDQSPFDQLLLPAPPAPNGELTSSAQMDSHVDLLSGEGYNAQATENPLALVPVSELVENSAPEQNILALSDMFSQNNNSSDGNNTTSPFGPHSGDPASQTNPAAPQLQLQPLQPALYSNGGLPSSGVPEHEQTAHFHEAQLNQANPSWNHTSEGLNPQPQSLAYGANGESGALPPPPWEAQPMQSSQAGGSYHLPMQNGQLGGVHPQPIQGVQFGTYPSMMQSNQLGDAYSRPIQGAQVGVMHQPMQSGQLMGHVYYQQPGTQFYGQGFPYTYASPNEISQSMYGLSMQDSSKYVNTNTSYQIPTSSPYVQQSSKPSKPEDKLFGDLVNMAKSKEIKPTANKVGSL